MGRIIFKTLPPQFNKKFEVVSSFCEHKGEILLLHRQDHKPEGNTWGVPAGKIDERETMAEAMVREMKEETGVTISPRDLVYFDNVFVKFPEYDFIYHMFFLSLPKKPHVTINNGEHKNFCWTSPKSALLMNLMRDLDACIKLFYHF